MRPVAHYTMGGIHTDMYYRVLDEEGRWIKGLFAAGEVAAASVHGANRLGSNSTAECLTSGRIAGVLAAEYVLKGAEAKTASPERHKQEEDFVWGLLKRESGVPSYEIKRELRTAMGENFYVFRTGDGIRAALSKILELRKKFKSEAYIEDKGTVYNTDLQSALETINLLDVALAAVKAGLERTESRGAHYRLDYPKRDDENWLKHTLVLRNGDDDVRLAYTPVDVSTWKPVERKY